jgi:hypothetical protein
MDEKKEIVDENLGKLARDKVTGFEGVITILGIHLYGCNTYTLTPKAKDGKLEDNRTFDMGRIEIIGECVKPAEVQGSKPGCEIANLDRVV